MLVLLFLLLQITLQTICSVLAWIEFRKKANKVWGYFGLAFSLMALRRVTALSLKGEYGAMTLIQTLDLLVLPFLITLLICLGFIFLIKDSSKSDKLLDKLKKVLFQGEEE